MGRPINPTVQTYVARSGRTSYRVRVRVGGRSTTETFDSLPAAEVFRLRCMDPNVGPARAVERRGREDTASSDYVPTLAEMTAKHVEGLTGIQQGTRDEYRSMAGRTWLPLLGSLRVDELTKDDVARWVNAADRDGHLKPKSIKNAHGLLSSVMETAVADGHAERNPARRTRLPRRGEEDVDDIRFLTTDEYWRLYDVFDPHHLPMLVTLFGTGLRYSEATAMQVRDLAIADETMRVVRAWKKQKGPLVSGPPKSRASRRTIALPVEVLEVLDPLVAGRAGSDLVFTTVRGNVVRHGNFYNRFWLTACARAGLDPSPRIHDARHTHASWLIARGIRLEVIQDRLGHEDYNTTRRIYGHLLPDMRREAGLAASAAFESRPVRGELD
jgi:integrase